ncbi:MAG: phosphonate C-P lyase system protein PhnH [Thermaceae bacterium]|nr:phosphonate C-P lyase system protein PhnH [Thermaceae bacterium]
MIPVFSPQEAQERETFLALMWALSRPGEPKTFGGMSDLESSRTAASARPSLESVGKALLDLEASFYTGDESLRKVFGRLGARFLGPEAAAYQFYPAVGERELVDLHEASVGTLLAPEQSATVVVACVLEPGLKLALSGPGVRGSSQIQISGLPKAFWNLRDQRVLFPLGWDVFLVSAKNEVIGIPRSTKVEVVG